MGWLRRALNGGRYDDGDRRRQLERYVAAGDALVAFLVAHGDADDATPVRARADTARELLRGGWTRGDLLALAHPVHPPWPGSRARDAGAAAPDHADAGDALYGAVNEAALELRAVGQR